MSIESKAEVPRGTLKEQVRATAESIISEFGQSFSQVTEPLRATRKVFCYGTDHWLSEGVTNQGSQKVIFVEGRSKDIDRRSKILYIIGPDNIIDGLNRKVIPEENLRFALNHLNVIERVLSETPLSKNK